MKLCLGTVQFGMDYGILGRKKPALEDAVKCLDYATQNGVLAIDTAAAYGTAEEVVGAFIGKRTVARERLFISTKLRPNILDDCRPEQFAKVIAENLEGSLRTLRLDYVDAYLLHSARYAFRPDILEALDSVRRRGLARRVGVSVYEPEEAVACFQDPHVDFIQAPYSIFDHRMKRSGILDHPQRGGCEIHTRSAFIQGLVTLREDQVPPFLERAKPILRRMDEICERNGVGRVELALAYVKRERSISHLVFGVDGLEQLKEDIELFEREVPAPLLDDIEREFEGIDADIVMPSLWKK